MPEWKVVGGAESEGILVRNGQGLKSAAATKRLSTGAIVEEVLLVGERLRYKLLSGDGPAEGWVSIKIASKNLLVPHDPSVDEPAKSSFDPYALLGVDPGATDATIKSAYRKASLAVHPDRCPDDVEAAAKFRQLTDARDFLLNPLQRLMYNIKHRLIQKTEGTPWWSEWEDILGEAAEELNLQQSAEEKSEVPCRPLADVKVDVLVLGATGITGMLACMVMKRWSKRSWAAAGRDGRKLEMLASKLGSDLCFQGTRRIETTADMECAVAGARIVVDFRGPAAHVGTEAVEACVRVGTHYVSVTADPIFGKMVKDSLDAKAKDAGVCLLLYTGYMALPTDFGVWHVVKHLREQHGMPTRRVDFYNHTRGFVLNGTTVLSGNTFCANDMAAYRKLGGSDFMLSGPQAGDDGQLKEDPKTFEVVKNDENSGMIAMLSEPASRAIVYASCASLRSRSQPYGDNFLIRNWMLLDDERQVQMQHMYYGFVHRNYERLIQEKKIPPRGCGAKERIRQETFITYIYVAEADEGKAKRGRKAYCVINAGPGGAGDRYEGAATMTLESACTILDAADNDGSVLYPGFGTPVHHLAHLGFLERLVAQGWSFKLIDEPPSHDFFRNVRQAAMPIQS